MSGQPDLLERMMDSLIDHLRAMSPAADYWFDYDVFRYSVLGESPSPGTGKPSLFVGALGGDSVLDDEVGSIVETVTLDMDCEMTHDVERDNAQTVDEGETERLILRIVADVRRGILEWVYKDPLELGEFHLRALNWNRRDPDIGRRQTGFGIFATVAYHHSRIDPRTTLFDPSAVTA